MNAENKSIKNSGLANTSAESSSDGLILVADDESAIVELIVECLNDSGYEIITARDGLEAVRLYKEAQPDLIISDIVMPKLDGLSVIKEIQQDFPELKAILMTGYPAVARDFLSEKMTELGVVCLLEKPLNVLELITTTHLIMDDRKTGQSKQRSPSELDMLVDFA
ncbi:MAG: response regulator [Pseudohongiellaceae bacterium]